MFKTYHWLSKMGTAKTINGYIYFFRKIPFIKKIFRSDTFDYPNLKTFIGGISFVLSFIIAIFKSAMSLGVVVLIMFLLLGDFTIMQEGFQVAIFFFYFCFGLIVPKVLSKEVSNFYNICVFKANPTNLGLSLSLISRLIQCFGRTLIFILILPIFDISILSAIIISLLCLGGQLIGEAGYLWLYKEKGKAPSLSTAYMIVLILIILICAGVLLKVGIYGDILTHYISIIFITGLTGLSWYYILNYDHYNEAFAMVARKEYYDVMLNPGAVTFSNVELKNSDLSISETNEKTGYSLLNTIFFRRHRRILIKPALIKSAVCTLIFIFALIYGLLFNSSHVKEGINIVINQYTMFPFLLYMLCNSEKVTRAMFLNCDFSLMRFGFYKEKKALLKMFSLRLRDVALINAIITLTISVGLILLTSVFASDALMAMVLVTIMTIVLGLFFTVHYLFIYYIFQPYTEDLKTKSPMYGVLKGIVYFLCWIMIGVESPQTVLLPIIILFSVLYTIVALVVVYTKAPKTFRVK
ncbi:hypothetical protein GC105_05410 [Alkalibaculum sp. M08DMB]|uniref:Uncharacterized protein n=1 Tax=Alkalibaculum sporogenes TaxID=2655001 RepID=A0A6A7K729_9FIRM|nr:hypothetical protein [Alkalibaculum sporogenes]MPW25224.1 hypothetical protein [Alkalibaculum sporogenes]